MARGRRYAGLVSPSDGSTMPLRLVLVIDYRLITAQNYVEMLEIIPIATEALYYRRVLPIGANCLM
jgi:hypothetical protein